MEKKKQRLGMAAVIILIILIAGGSLYAFFSTRQKGAVSQQDMARGEKGQFAGMENVITASGTTAIGMDAVTFDIDFLEETSLYVEEVYYTNGDEVKSGEKLFKLTEESVQDAREELTNTAKEAELSYRSSVITTNQSKIQAKYTYETALLESQQAEQVYNDAIAELQAKVDQTKAAYDEAQEAYNELYNAIETNTLRDLYKVDEKKAAYEEAHELYITKVAYWGVTEEELSESTSGESAGGGAAQGSSAGGNGGMQGGPGMDNSEMAEQADRKWIIKTIQLLKEEDAEAEAAYEQAESDYEDALENAELNIQLLFNKLETAREDYEDATLNFQVGSASAKTTYELAVATNGTAKTDYDTTLTSLAESLEKLKDAKEDADENLALFEELVGDGYYYTTEAGTILMIRATKDQALTGGDMLFAYSNPAEITVSVSVSQDDIAELTVGDSATIMITDVGNYTGTIKTINPIASSDSRSSVSYTVELSVDGDVSGIEANLTATVIFGEFEMPQGMPEGGEMPEGMPDGGEMPEGAEMPGEMPQGMPEGAEMPQGNGPQMKEAATNE